MTSVAAQTLASQQIKAVLDSINWSFSTPFTAGRSSVGLFDCRKHHWYPGTFIPEIPLTLIDVLSFPGSTVYDPFGGIGTTFFQSILLGRRAFATETCSVAVDFMRSLMVLFGSNSSLSDASLLVEHIRAEYDSQNDYSQNTTSLPLLSEKLRPWFNGETFNQLMYLALYESLLKDKGLRAATRIALSATFKAVCAQDRGWGCIADNMVPKLGQLTKTKSAIDRFARNFMVLFKDVTNTKKFLHRSSLDFLDSTLPENAIFQQDVRTCYQIGTGSVDLIVTSPPYPNMTDYATSQRLSYYWLGYEPSEDLRVEIGARRKRFSSASVNTYREEMQAALRSMIEKLKPGGYACFVMPSFDGDASNDLFRRQSVQESMATLLSHGCVLEYEIDRSIPVRRRHHNQKWTSLEKETISVYRKV